MSLERLEDLDVVISHPTDRAPRVEIVDKRTLISVVSLTQIQARILAVRLMERAEATRPPPLPGSRPAD